MNIIYFNYNKLCIILYFSILHYIILYFKLLLCKMNLDNELEQIKAIKNNTIFQGNQELIPLSESMQITSFAIIQDENFEEASTFFRFLSEACSNDFDFGYINLDISQEELNKFKMEVISSELFLFPLFFDEILTNDKIENIKNIINTICPTENKILIDFSSNHIFCNTGLSIMINSISLHCIAASVVILSGRNLGTNNI